MSRQHEFVARCTVGETLEGTVVRVEPFGAFVEVADGAHGFLHESEWSEPPEPGDPVRAQILDIDVEAGRMSLRPV